MPFIDVTDVLTDPDFATTFSVIQAQETIGANGRAAYAQTTVPNVSGVVIPGKGNLQRLPDGSRLSGTIDIYTQFSLSEGGSGPATAAADIVVWRGRQYTVTASQDFSEFGAGFIVATADLLGVNT